MSWMVVAVKKTDKDLGVKKGEVYLATMYSLDEGKVTLVARLPDGYNPMVNQYWVEVDVLCTQAVPSRTFEEDHAFLRPSSET